MLCCESFMPARKLMKNIIYRTHASVYPVFHRGPYISIDIMEVSLIWICGRHTVPDTPKFPFNARIRLYWPLVRSHSICSHSLSGECELMRYIWPKANARIRGHSCAHSHLGISHSHNSINYPIQMRALASRCYAHSHYLALLKQSIFQSKCECASNQSIVSTHDCKPWGPLWSVCYQ